MYMLLTVSEDSATLGSDMSADMGFGGKSDTMTVVVALLFLFSFHNSLFPENPKAINPARLRAMRRRR